METDPFWQTGAEVVFSGETTVYIHTFDIKYKFCTKPVTLRVFNVRF